MSFVPAGADLAVKLLQFLSGTAFCHSDIATLYHYLAISPKFFFRQTLVSAVPSASAPHTRLTTTGTIFEFHTFYSLYSSNSHFIINIFIMARFKPVGKTSIKKMAPAKLGQDNMRSSCQVVAGSVGASSGAAAGTASPVTAPADDTFVLLAGSLGTETPSGISILSATGVPPPKKGSSRAKKHAKGSIPSATEAAAISVAAASSSINTSDSAPFTADAITTEMKPICQ
jgi:hypothetical protein